MKDAKIFVPLREAIWVAGIARVRIIFSQRVKQILKTPGPVVCEVEIAENQFTAPRVSSSKRADGTMESKPMEDLWLFLDREEFEANMISNLSRQFPQ